MPPATVCPTPPPPILDILDRLRALSQKDVRATWHRCSAPSEAPSIPPTDRWQTWPLAALDDRGYIVWPRGNVPLWLHQRFTWPTDLNGYPLEGLTARLALRWWAHQADIFVNGELVQSGDIFDCWTRIVLTEAVVPGGVVDVSLRLLSPGHDEGALVQAELVFEQLTGDCPEPGFVADELAVLATNLAQFEPEKLDRVMGALRGIDWNAVDGSGTDSDAETIRDRRAKRERFHQSLLSLRDSLKSFSPWLKQRTVHCLGHAHLDLAWLWPVADTWQAAENTFRSVLALQRDFPELTFSHSSPALFAWLEDHCPDLFATIQQQVKTGRWAIDAGLWVEPDLNLPGGEAIARQILYGQRYCAEKFGEISAIAWLPDTFGFCWQLPQLLTQGGIRYFATQKLRWNDTNPFPHDLFTWQGPDGSEITGVTLPPIGTDIDPVAMAQYACQWEANTGCTDALWLPGVGDHGGGPTRDMLLKARRWANSPFFPTLTFGHATPLFDALTDKDANPPKAAISLSPSPHPPSHPSTLPPIHPPTLLPIWRDELYLELHRGCYTTHGDQKQYNRRCEDILFQAELFAAIAAIYDLQPYPRAELEAAWKRVLFNQFHDILPGSSIPEVFEQANGEWQLALETGDRILQTSLTALAQRCPIPAPPHPHAVPVVLFNSLNWERSEVVAIALPTAQPQAHWQAQDAEGRTLLTQREQTEAPSLLVYVPGIPSVGYRLIWLLPAEAPLPTALPNDWALENEHLRARIDPSTGAIASLVHKLTGTETFHGCGNQLQAFKDQGQYWDAWNIAPDYQDHPLANFQLQRIHWVEYGPVRQTLRVVQTFNQSTITQDYRLEVGSPVLAVHTQVDWQETQVVFKVAFPLTVSAAEATYEIPFGAIARATTPVTPQDAAKWEVPALRWADLSDGDRGVSILTDYKHGFDATPNQLRLTLLKAPIWPDPGCDRGLQTFGYAIYPHAQGWQQAKTVQVARRFNLPIQACLDCPTASSTTSPTSASWLNFDDASLVLSAFKQAEDRADQYILRAYESTGTSSPLTLGGTLPVDILSSVDLLEQPKGTTPPAIAAPWQVISLALAPVL
ncbi:alpha-mannosidase [Nodosilinea sp. LEGE 06152]|uniref:alpha-mannosidase n=1 Tax=Nodosilinea sp. LEGE 06152 TaxID=2777966 RepID=UPI001880BAFC|nr:alpha-mannosidase [Nodosilinea sp. LEGE 06152]MBE9158640.1 alpha-mannosidase [Nodosilinea sp. LEGE 06152]